MREAAWQVRVVSRRFASRRPFNPRLWHNEAIGRGNDAHSTIFHNDERFLFSFINHRASKRHPNDVCTFIFILISHPLFFFS